MATFWRHWEGAFFKMDTDTSAEAIKAAASARRLKGSHDSPCALELDSNDCMHSFPTEDDAEAFLSFVNAEKPRAPRKKPRRQKRPCIAPIQVKGPGGASFLPNMLPDGVNGEPYTPSSVSGWSER